MISLIVLEHALGQDLEYFRKQKWIEWRVGDVWMPVDQPIASIFVLNVPPVLLQLPQAQRANDVRRKTLTPGNVARQLGHVDRFALAKTVAELAGGVDGTQDGRQQDQGRPLDDLLATPHLNLKNRRLDRRFGCPCLSRHMYAPVVYFALCYRFSSPYSFNFRCNVRRLTPILCAAFVRLPSVSFNAWTINCRSASSTVIPARTTLIFVRSALPRIAAGTSRTVKRSPRANTTICSMALRSSRTLPGQSYASSRFVASGVNSRTCLPFSRLNSSRNDFTSNGMSSRRSRNGGRSTVTTLSR